MREEDLIARPEHERAAELERVLAQSVLPVAAGSRSRPRGCVVATEDVDQRATPELRSPVGDSILVDEEREADPSLVEERSRVAHVAQSDRG